VRGSGDSILNRLGAGWFFLLMDWDEVQESGEFKYVRY